MTSIYDIGPETANRLINMGVTGIDDLISKVSTGQIQLNDKQLIGLIYHLHFEQRIPRDEVQRIGNLVLNVLSQIDTKAKGQIVGSYRRGRPSSGDVDILITGPSPRILQLLFDRLIQIGFIEHILTQGEHTVRGTFWSNYPTDQTQAEKFVQTNRQILQTQGQYDETTIPGILRKIDIKYVPERSWGNGLLHYTGSDEFNKGLRRYLQKQGWSLSEYSLSTEDQSQIYTFPNEEDLFKAMGLDYVPPEDRAEFKF